MPSYPINKAPTPVKGWTFIKSRIIDTGSYDQYNKPFLDFEKNVVQANAGSSNFVCGMDTRRRTSFEGKGIPTPPDTNLGHFNENMVELWIMLEGTLDFLIEGEPLITGTVGDVVQAPKRKGGMALTSPCPRHDRGITLLESASSPFACQTGFDSGRKIYLTKAIASSRCIARAETAVDMSIQAPRSRGSGPTTSISLCGRISQMACSAISPCPRASA